MCLDVAFSRLRLIAVHLPLSKRGKGLPLRGLRTEAAFHAGYYEGIVHSGGTRRAPITLPVNYRAAVFANSRTCKTSKDASPRPLFPVRKIAFGHNLGANRRVGAQVWSNPNCRDCFGGERSGGLRS
jgi:hypothetical protein